MCLTVEDFATWFRELHGVDPFPWQRRLLAALVSDPDAGWPRAVTLPTASGKTALIDIALFHLALQAEQPDRRAPLRLFFVVDRRVVVDEAFERARRIAEALRVPSGRVTGEVARRLRGLADGDLPLACALLRGGVYRDDAWARTPTQPTVVVSTVDQVGSRLLFRGYGLRGGYSRPVHAGLVANDALVVVDEAHVSLPFVQTADAVALFRRWAEHPVGIPLQIVRMSATLPAETRFELDAEDRTHEVLSRRLSARKLAQLVEGRGKGRLGPVRNLVEQARALSGEARGPGGGAPVVGVIVNRVATARACFEALAGGSDTAAILLTGRVRPLDRDLLLRDWRERLTASPTRAALSVPAFVVATQCIEVGANLDFDALVTECASLDALRQRFGRLDRLGLHGETKAAIVHDSQTGDDDPIYGGALAAAWAWLRAVAADDVVDLGIAGFEGHETAQRPPPEAFTSPRQAPVLLPAYVDLWSQTSPAPAVEPDPALFLHGSEPARPEVQLVWRADLDPAAPGAWVEAVAQLPPTAAEAMAVPLFAVRRWLAGEGEEPADADMEAAATEAPALEAPEAAVRPVLRWFGPEESHLVSDPAEVRPGDLLIVPAVYGGCDRYGWQPATPVTQPSEPVGDRGEVAHARARARAALRLHATTRPRGLNEDLRALYDRVASWGDFPVEDEELSVLEDLLRGLAERPEDPGLESGTRDLLETERVVARTLLEGLGRGTRIVRHASGRGLVLTSRARIPGLTAAVVVGSDFTDEDASSSATVRVPLAEHNAGVGGRTRRFASRLGLSKELVNDLALAGELHDLGKADPRFQAWLRGGDPYAFLADPELLAKSERIGESRVELAAAQKRSGYPEGARHELLSVRLAEDMPRARARAKDWDLVLHLIAAHHGRCRPFAPVVDDPAVPAEHVVVQCDGEVAAASAETELERLDSGVADRFWALTRRYGWWGLAYLEAVLRLADHRQSEAEVEGARGVRRGRVAAVGA